MKHAQVITNKKVATTFNSVECLLRRTLTKLEKTNGIRRYTITTDYVNFVETQIPITEQVEVLDAEDNPTGEFTTQPVLDAEGNPTYNVVTNLVSLGLAKATTATYNSTIANAMFEQIRPLIDFSKPFSEIMFTVEQLSLLGGTQQDVPLGTAPEDWEIYNG